MSEMVERVARALAQAQKDAFPDEHWMQAFDEMDDVAKRHVAAYARAAIAAMRAPTEKMIEEASYHFDCTTQSPRSKETWQTMIDEALR